MYTVTATDNGSANGDISPASVDVQYGQTTTFSTTNVATGYTASFSGCGTSGSSGTTSAITGNCSVTVTFNAAAASPGSDPGYGGGVWQPPGTTGQFVVDPSGNRGDNVTTTYLPGCLDHQVGETAFKGCATNANYNNITLNNSVVSLRYKTKSAATINGKYGYSTRKGSDGQSPSRQVWWISRTPNGTALPGCKAQYDTDQYLITGPSPYCTLEGSTEYYMNFQTSSCIGCRIILIEDVNFE